MAEIVSVSEGVRMTALILAALLLWPVPPLGATLGSGTPYRVPVASVATRTELPATGLATFYSENIMDGVLSNRIRWGHIQPGQCPHCRGYVALLWPADIGREICTNVNGVVFGPYLVIDSASQRDRPGLLSDGWVLDADNSVWFDQWKLPRNPTIITITECE